MVVYPGLANSQACERKQRETRPVAIAIKVLEVEQVANGRRKGSQAVVAHVQNLDILDCIHPGVTGSSIHVGYKHKHPYSLSLTCYTNIHTLSLSHTCSRCTHTNGRTFHVARRLA
jgi:hypothetical protein